MSQSIQYFLSQKDRQLYILTLKLLLVHHLLAKYKPMG